MIVAKISDTQRYFLEVLQGKRLAMPAYDRRRKLWIYMPYQSDMRSFNALERKGLVKWVRVDDGYPSNGYVITEAGLAATV